MGEDEGRTALLIDGVVQSVVVGEAQLDSGYWWAMAPEGCPQTALLLGFGGGTIATLLHRRFGEVAITAVEKHAAVVEVAQDVFGVRTPQVTIIVGDAFEFVSTQRGQYDYIAVDLFEAGAVPARIFTRPFLRSVKALASPGGTVVINFFRDRRMQEHQRRLEAVFPRVAFTQCGKNVVAHCRPR